MARKVIGIDFGTTFSSVSFLPLGSQDAPSLLQFSGARHHVPTLLHLDPNDDSVLDWGWTAQAAIRRSNGIVVSRNFKRTLGESEESRELTLHYLKALEETIRDKQGRLPQLEEEDFITSIGAPANWTEPQKDLLKSLAIEAGFPEVRIVPEPVAAMHNLKCHATNGFKFGDRPETFMVIDFGGGTLDICIVKTQELGREPQVLSIDGDPRLGGVDFDEIVEKWFLRQSDLNLDSMSPHDKARLRESIQDAKENMSDVFRRKAGESLFQTTIHLTTGAHVFEATKNEFFNRCREAGILENISEAVGRALQKCGLQAKDIKRVVLTGGSSRWFFVRQLIAKEMGLGGEDELLETDSPYTDVASGLSIHYGRSNEPSARPGVWLKYQLPGSSKQDQKMLVAPGRLNLVRDDRLYLGEISGTRLLRGREIQFEWLQGPSDSKLISNGCSKLSAHFRANHPKIERIRNTWDALRGRETKPRIDSYKVFIITNEDPLHGISHKVELIDNRGEVRHVNIRAGEHVKYTWWGLGEPVRTDFNPIGKQRAVIQDPPPEEAVPDAPTGENGDGASSPVEPATESN